MPMFDDLKRRYRQWERQKAIQFLTTVEPEKLAAHGDRLVIEAFQRVAQRVPAYRSLLQNRGIDPRSVTDVETFRQVVPVISKEDVFPCNDIEDLCLDGRLDRMKTPMSSSGFSGVFSFGINTGDNLKNAEKSIDTALDYVFNISRKKTFLINCVPMGVKIPTSLPVADTSVRPDMALAIYKKFSGKFDQTIFVSDPHFLKKVVEDGLEQGIDWKRENVHLISGEDWFPESLRSYLGDILGTDWSNPRRGLFCATMGIAELDLNLFHESVYTIRIRRAAETDAKLRHALFGEGVEVSPIVFHYYPHKLFLEALGTEDGPKELVFSMLSQTLLIPLMRYNSKDTGVILPYNRVRQVLDQCGYAHLCPDLKLPLVAVGGRKGRAISINNRNVTPEEARSLLYQDFHIAGQVTGNFLLKKEGDRTVIEIQLKEGISPSDDLQGKCNRVFAGFTELTIKILPYYEFKHGLSVNYEKKFVHIL